MAFHTISKIGDAFFQMLLAYVIFGVGVTVGASVFYIVAGVAGLARNLPFAAVVKGEGVSLKLGR